MLYTSLISLIYCTSLIYLYTIYIPYIPYILYISYILIYYIHPLYPLYTVSLLIVNYLALSHCQLFLGFTVCLTEFDNYRAQTVFCQPSRLTISAKLQVKFKSSNFIRQ